MTTPKLKAVKTPAITKLANIAVQRFQTYSYQNGYSTPTLASKAGELHISQATLKEIETHNKEVQDLFKDARYRTDGTDLYREDLAKAKVPGDSKTRDVLVSELEALIEKVKTFPEDGIIRKNGGYYSDVVYQITTNVLDKSATETYNKLVERKEELMQKARTERKENLATAKKKAAEKEANAAKLQAKKILAAEKATAKEAAETALIVAITNKINKGMKIEDSEGNLIAKILSA